MPLTLAKAMELCERHVRHKQVDCALSYGEPGYPSTPLDARSGILFADWNDCPKWLTEGLERRGFALEWSDEWVISHENNSKAYRTSPTSYGWRPYFVMSEDGGDIVGGDEIESGNQAEWYVEKYLFNDPTHCNVFRGLDLAKHGFKQFNGVFESGWHLGQDDDPKKVFARIQEEMPGHDVVFSLESTGQFDMHWTAWVRPHR